VLDGAPDPPSARGEERAFDAAFAKLLWPFITFLCYRYVTLSLVKRGYIKTEVQSQSEQFQSI